MISFSEKSLVETECFFTN